MSNPELTAEALASAVHIHGEAEITGTRPLTIRTPELPWSYAASFPLQVPDDDDFVVEAVVKVTSGAVGMSCTDERYASLVGEQAVRRSKEPVRLVLLPDAAHKAHVLVRTWAKPGPATVEVHEVRSRSFTADERAQLSGVATLRPVPRWHQYYGTAGESLVEQVRVRDYLRLTAPTPRPWLDDLSVVVYPGDQLSRALYVSGLYEPNTALVLKRYLTRGGTFLDVGAHAGIFTMLGSRFVGESGRVFSFEPSPRERARLEEHVAINHLANVTVVSAAVSGAAGRAILNVAPPQYGGLNTLGERFAYPGVESVDSVEVDVVTLDEFAERHAIDRIDAVKLDIEGAECAALHGAARILRELRPPLVIELVASALGANGATPRELEQQLSAARYRLFSIDEETADPRPLEHLANVDEQNIVALPAERAG